MNASGVGTSRRTLTKGIAWSVPVVAATVAAPMASASGQCSGTTCFGGVVIHKCCKGKYYWADVTFTNGANLPVFITFSFTLTPSANPPVPFGGGGIVPRNSSRTFRVGSPFFGNCSNATWPAFTIYFTDGINPPGQVLVPGGSTGGSTCPPGSGPDELDAETDSATESDAPAEPAPTETDAPAEPGPTESAPAEPAPEQPTPQESASAPAPEPTETTPESTPEPSASS